MAFVVNTGLWWFPLLGVAGAVYLVVGIVLVVLTMRLQVRIAARGGYGDDNPGANPS